MEHAIASFCDWLGNTPISMVIQSVAWIIPMVQSVHIMAVTIVVGSVLMVDMKLLGVVGRGSPISAATRRYLPWIWAALVVLLLTGSILTMAEPRRELINNVFRLKMALIVLMCAVTGAFQLTVSRNAAKARELGHDPLTMQTELAARAMDSGLLAPQKSLEARLAELDDLRARGVITAEEHAKARADALAGS